MFICPKKNKTYSVKTDPILPRMHMRRLPSDLDRFAEMEAKRPIITRQNGGSVLGGIIG